MPSFNTTALTREQVAALVKKNQEESWMKKPLAPAPEEAKGWGGFAGGALTGPWDIVKGLASRVGQSMSQLNEVEAQYTDPAGPTSSIAENLNKLTDSATIGASTQFRQEIERARISNPDNSLDKKIVNSAKAGFNVGLDMILARPALETLFQGKVRTGIDPVTGDYTYRQASENERGKAISSVALAALPAVGAYRVFKNTINKKLPGALVISDKLDDPSKTFSTRELKSGSLIDTIKEGQLAEQSRQGIVPKNVPNLPLVDDATVVEQFRNVHGETLKKATIADSALTYARVKKAGGSLNEGVSRAIIENIDPVELSRYVDPNTPINDIAPMVSKYVLDQSSEAGQIGAVGSLTKKIYDAQLITDAMDSQSPRHTEAAKFVKDLGILNDVDRTVADAKLRAGGADTRLGVAGRLVNEGISSAISLPFSAVRNAESNALITGARQFSEMVNDRILGKIYSHLDDPGKVKTLHESTMEHLTSAMSELGPERVAQLKAENAFRANNRILKNLPAVSGRMLGDTSIGLQGAVDKAMGKSVAKGFFNQYRPSSYGIEGGMLGLAKTEVLGHLEGIKAMITGDGKNLDNFIKATDASTGMLSGLNRTTEYANRKFAFMLELDRNARKVGYKGGLQDVSILLEGSDQMPPQLRQAIAQAERTITKDTFAYRYQDGMAGSVLNVYDKFGPLTKVLGPKFPRFVTNSWRLALDYSPTNMLEVFNPTFRAELMKGTAGGIRTVQAQEVLSRALTGAVTLGGMMLLRSSEHAGPKYWEVKSPGSDSVIDLNQYPGLSQYALLADVLLRAKEGRPQELSPDEISNALLGSRHLNDMEIFNIDDMIKTIVEEGLISNKTGQVVGGAIGKELSMFLTPLSAIRELVGGLEQQAHGYKPMALAVPNNQNNPMTGPLTQRVPKLFDALTGSGDSAKIDLSDPSVTVPRVNSFNGETMRTENPFMRQLLGQNIRKANPVEEMVYRLPGIEPNDLHKTYKDQRATHAVDELLGKVIKSQTPLFEKIYKSNAITDEAKAEMFKSKYQEIRRVIEHGVKKQHPDWFIEEDIKDKNTRNFLKNLTLK